MLNRLRVLTGFCKSKRPGEISKDERYLVFWNHQIPYPLTKISSLHLKMKLLPICTWLICLLLVIVCLGSECGTPRRIVRSKRDLVRIREARSTFPGPCATRLPRGKRSLPGIDRRSPRLSQAGESSPGPRRAVYFTGRGDQLRLKPNAEVPRGNFSLEMWIKPEGGQRSPAVIGGLIFLIMTCCIFTAEIIS